MTVQTLCDTQTVQQPSINAARIEQAYNISGNKSPGSLSREYVCVRLCARVSISSAIVNRDYYTADSKQVRQHGSRW